MALLAVTVAVIVSAVYWPVLSTQALTCDDHEYLAYNPLVQNPGWGSAARFLGEVLQPSTVSGYYQPLAMISLMLDYACGGRPQNLRPFHRTSLLLHAANVALLVVLLYLLFGQAWPAALTGLLFGLHPLGVESVAWVAARKTLLATFFSLCCLVLYARCARKGDWKLYAACLAMFVLALMSKPTCTPLPVVMLLLDYWPLRRLSRRTIMQLVPLFAVAGVFGLITLVSQGRAASIYLPGEYFSAMGTLFVLCHNVVFYLYKIVWPVDLSLHYPFPEPLTLSDPMVFAGVVGTGILILGLLISWRWTRAFVVGWLAFFVAIFPTLGVIGFQDAIAADRHAYFPVLGLLLIVVWLLGRLWGATPHGVPTWARRAAGCVVLLIVAVPLGRATRHQLEHWADSEQLHRYVLSLSPHEPEIQTALGYSLLAKGRLDDAIHSFHDALELDADYVHAHYNLGIALQRQGKSGEAIVHLTKAVELRPRWTEARRALGSALARRGELDQAIQQYSEALRVSPSSMEVHNDLAIALARQGRIHQAREQFCAALRIQPENLVLRGNLARMLSNHGQPDEAIEQYNRMLELNPDYVPAHVGLGEVLEKQGRLDAAIKHYHHALRIDPKNRKARASLDAALAKLANS